MGNGTNSVGISIGISGTPSTLEPFVKSIPNANVRQFLDKALDVSGAAGSKYGASWTGSINLDDQGVAQLNISGFRIPLGDFIEATQSVDSLNGGSKSVQRLNNEEAYVNGENPFVQADATRARLPDGTTGAYLNHGDPVAAIAGNTLDLQRQLMPTFSPIRSNGEAANFLEYAIERSSWLTPEQAQQYSNLEGIEDAKVDPNPMSNAQKQQLQSLLVQMDRQGMYFGSERVKTEAASASSRAPDQPPANTETSAFTRDVFEGDYRRSDIDSRTIADRAIETVIASNLVLTIFAAVLSSPVASDDIALAKSRASFAGFRERMAVNHPDVVLDDNAASFLYSALSSQLYEADIPITGESTFQRFQALGTADQRQLLLEADAETR